MSFFPFAFSYGNCQHVFITNFITFLLLASVGKFDFCRPVGRGQKKTLRRIETIVGLEGGGECWERGWGKTSTESFAIVNKLGYLNEKGKLSRS